MIEFSIVIPAKNEESGLEKLLPTLLQVSAPEIIVVDDGSTDSTAEVCSKYGVKLCQHSYSKGNGAAIKTGLRAAKGKYVLFMDADGQHDLDALGKLIAAATGDIDMVVGARSFAGQAGVGRGLANSFYNWFSSAMVGHKIFDLTSGLRLVNREKMLEFVHLLPNGFSYPTTITMAFFRAGYSVKYIPVMVHKRLGKSHIHPIKDGVRFLLIIFKVASLYSPLKLYFPTSLLFFITGIIYYIYTYSTDGRFTNMGMLMFVTSILIFFMGLISEQITALNYQRKN